MSDDHVLGQVEETRKAANDSTVIVRRVYLTFLLATIYGALVVATTTDQQLLIEGPLRLPILGVEVSVIAVYVIGPPLYVVLHLNLFIVLYLLARKLRALNSALRGLSSTLQRDYHSRLLLPFPFSQILVGRGHAWQMWLALRFMVSLPVIVFPLLLLLAMQARFLPYHNPDITLLHRVVVSLDIGLIVVLWPIIMSGREKWSIDILRFPRGGDVANFVAGMNVIIGIGFIVVAGLFAFFLAVIPGDDFEWPASRSDHEAFNKDCGLHFRLEAEYWRRLLLDCGHTPFHRNLDLREKILVRREPPSEVIAAFLGDGKSKEDAWAEFADGLVLQNRDLRYANFTRARLYNVDLRGARLRGARLDEAMLPNAELRAADLSNANLVSTVLTVVDFGPGQIQDPKEGPTNLKGADLTYAKLQGANLRVARLQGADLLGAELQGADMSWAKLQGAVLLGAKLQGAVLSRAELQGAVLSRAELQGADLSDAELQGADLRAAFLGGADLSTADLSLADLWGVTFDSFEEWQTLRGRINERVPAGPGREIVLKRIEQAEKRVTKLPGSAPVLGARFKPSLPQFAGWGSPLSNEAYGELLAQLLIRIACTNNPADSMVGPGIALRLLESWNGDRHPRRLIADVAQALLAEDCAGSEDLTPELRDQLDAVIAEAATPPD